MLLSDRTEAVAHIARAYGLGDRGADLLDDLLRLLDRYRDGLALHGTPATRRDRLRRCAAGARRIAEMLRRPPAGRRGIAGRCRRFAAFARTLDVTAFGEALRLEPDADGEHAGRQLRLFALQHALRMLERVEAISIDPPPHEVEAAAGFLDEFADGLGRVAAAIRVPGRGRLPRSDVERLAVERLAAVWRHLRGAEPDQSVKFGGFGAFAADVFALPPLGATADTARHAVEELLTGRQRPTPRPADLPRPGCTHSLADVRPDTGETPSTDRIRIN
jgi:hypothetical protein